MPNIDRISSLTQVSALLRPSQRAAVDVVRNYVRKSPSGHALVRMPTGSGKTGVMAVTAQLAERDRLVLVVAPFVPLIEQLMRNVGSDFWTRALGAKVPPAKKIARMRVLNAKALLAAGDAQTIFCTTQALAALRRTAYRREFKRLQAMRPLVLVDEGHREPAPRWAEAIRGVSSSVVLFSATPFRNDNNVFDINPSYAFRRTYDETVRDEETLREPKFVAIDGVDPEGFARALVAWCRTHASQIGPTYRVIVRCERLDDIRAVCAALRRLGQSAIGVHDRGQPNTDVLERVPDPKTQDVRYWVHQFKLLEGFDDPLCNVLAFYGVPKNHRSVIQQIGRVLRRRTKADRYAFVLAREPNELSVVWDQYRQYERYTVEHGVELTTSSLLSFTESASPVAYLFGGFVSPRNASAPLDLDELRVPKSVIALHKGAAATKDVSAIDFRVLATAIEEDFRRQTIALRAPVYVDRHVIVALYVEFEPSKLSSQHVWVDSTQHVLVIVRHGEFMFCASTGGGVPDSVRRYVDPVDPSQLATLIPRRARVRDVTLRNTDLGRFAARRRAVTAFDLADLAAGLGDHRYICATASGTVQGQQSQSDRVSRYVGFINARIRESGGRALGFADFLAWSEHVAKQLEKRPGAEGVLRRYARHRIRVAAKHARPEHLLFDIPRDLVLQDADESADEIPAEDVIPDLSCPVDASGKWSLTGTPSRAFAGTVAYDPGRHRYQVECEGFKNLFVRDERVGHHTLSLEGYLNSHQAFRIVASGDLVYAHGHFFESLIGTPQGKAAMQPALEAILHSSAALDSLTEKGARGSARANGWSDASIFGLIDKDARQHQSLFKDIHPTRLVCDDLNDEIADFIAVAEGAAPAVVLIHAKDAHGTGNPGSRAMSVSALHDVVAQAAKNLAVFASEDVISQAKSTRWSGQWTDGRTGTVSSRIRIPSRGTDGPSVAALVSGLARNPQTRKEVWLVVSRGLSRSALLGELEPAVNGSRELRAEAMQAIMLLLTLNDAVGSVGARLRVWCRP